MAGDKGLGRREVILLAGTAVAGRTFSRMDRRPEFSIELAVTEELADLSEEEAGNRDYTAEVMEEMIERSVRPFVSGLMDVSVEYSGVEPSVKMTLRRPGRSGNLYLMRASAVVC